jgi:hypothetical protein
MTTETCTVLTNYHYCIPHWLHQLLAVGGGSSHTLSTILSFCNKNGSNGKTQQPANYLKKHKRERDDQGNQDERGTKEIMKKQKPKQKEQNQGNRHREREREHGKLQAQDILRNNWSVIEHAQIFDREFPLSF